MKRKIWSVLMALTLGMALLSGCGAAQTAGAAEEEPAVSTAGAAQIDAQSAFTQRDMDASYDAATAVDITLTGEGALCESENVTVTGSTVTVTDEGTYLLRGTLRGTIVVDADKTDKVQLVLCGAEITADGTAAVYVRQADKVFLTLAEGSDNTLAAQGDFTAAEESNIDGAVFSKDDLTMNGTGSLTISAPAGHGVVSKDDLVITSGTYTVSAGGHGFSGKESLRVAGGRFAVTVGKDGFHAEDKDDEMLGWLYVADGTFTVTAQGDGFSAAQTLRLDGGDYAVATGGGSASVSHTAQGIWAWDGHGSKGGMAVPDGAAAPDAVSSATPDTTASSTDAAAADTVSAKGFKSGVLLLLGGGRYHMDCADDTFHSNGDISLTGGDYTLSTGDDGFHADGTVTVSGGSITVTASYEGMEGTTIAINGGDIALTSSDDGLNAAGGADGSGAGGYGGFEGGGFTGSDCAILISGGTLRVTASGDGIDSNGSLAVTGGEVYVSGPADNNNGALDYGAGATISGGTFAAAGSAGMAQSFGGDSTQCAMLVSTGAQAAGSAVTLTDSNGKTLLTYTPESDYACVVLSCGDLVQGGTYTLTAGSFTTHITMESLLYSDVTGAMGGMGGGMGHGGQGAMDGGAPTRPADGAKPFPDKKTA